MVALPSSSTDSALHANGSNGNAHASSSKVKLEDLQQYKMDAAQSRLDTLVRVHAGELRDLYIMHEQQKEIANNDEPAVPKAPFQMPDTSIYEEGFAGVFADHRLNPANAKGTVSTYRIPTSAALKRKLAAEMASSSNEPANKAKVPKSEAAKATKEAKASTQSARSTAAQSTSANSKATSSGGPASTGATSPSINRSTSTRRQSATDPQSLPSFATPPPTSSSSTATTSEPAVATSSSHDAAARVAAPEVTVGSPAVPSSENSSAATPINTALPAATMATQPPLPQSSLLAVPQPNIHGQSPLQHQSQQRQEEVKPPPLHPTLQHLAPNPLSVTYASSLRPLPSDPFRKYTGSGIGGGASNNRLRKPPQPSTPNKSTAPLGPAGMGQTDLWRWYVRSRASPGAGLVGKADKCLLTKDWQIAFAEQRFLRAMARIEKLKEAGTWSFRQPKKQKGPVVRKSHWDHVLDEMKWMQTDFREERRWKMAVCRQLAQACRAWKKAKTPQARASLCIKAAPIRHIDPADLQIKQELEAEGDETKHADATSVLDRDRAASPMEVEGKEEADTASGAVDEIEVDADGEAEEEDADGEVDADGDADDGEVEAATLGVGAASQQDPPAPLGEQPMPQLSGSAPVLLGQKVVKRATEDFDDHISATAMRTSAQGAGDTLLPADDSKTNGHSLAWITTLRAPIFAMDISTTVVALPTLLDAFDVDPRADLDPKLLDIFEGHPTTSIASLFPELPEYGPPMEPEVGKSDKRWDEGSLNQAPRLTQVSRILDAKPLLVSTLEPSKNRANGRWREDGEWAMSAKLADPLKGVTRQELDAILPPATTIFSRRSNKPSKDVVSAVPHFVLQPKDTEIRAAQILWSNDEDAFLLKLYQQYGSNWPLIADLFNSTRLSVPTDRREPWDCFDRWDRITKAAAQGQPPPPPPQLPSAAAASSAGPEGAEKASPAQPTVPAGSLAAKREKLVRKLGAKYDGSRKRMRHSNIMEVMKKTARRRDATAKPPFSPTEPRKVSLAAHETHNISKGGPSPTAAQLSALKADRDEAQMRQYYQYQQRRLEEQQRIAAAQAAQQAQQQQSQSSQNHSSSGQQQQQQGQMPNSQSQQQQQQQQQPNGSSNASTPQQRGTPMMNARPPPAGARPPMGPRPGTPNNGASSSGPASGGPQQQQQQQRMTPQQQQQALAQIRPSMQQYNMAMAAAAAAAAGGGVANGQGMGRPPQATPPNGNANGNGPTNGAASAASVAGSLGSLGNLPAVTIAQIQATLQSQLAANLSQEQIQNLAMQLFRNAQQGNLPGQQAGVGRPPGIGNGVGAGLPGARPPAVRPGMGPAGQSQNRPSPSSTAGGGAAGGGGPAASAPGSSASINGQQRPPPPPGATSSPRPPNSSNVKSGSSGSSSANATPSKGKAGK